MYYPSRTYLRQFYKTSNQQMWNFRRHDQVCYEDLLIAKKHLDKLRDQNNKLILQEFTEMRSLCISSSNAVEELTQNKAVLSKQLIWLEAQVERLEALNDSHQKKVIHMQEELENAKESNQKTLSCLSLKDEQVFQREQQVNKLLNNIKLDKEILEEIENTNKDLLGEIKNSENIEKETKKNIQNLNNQIIKQKAEIKDLQHILATQQLQIQNTKLKIQNQDKNQQNLKHRLEIANKKIQQNFDNENILMNQSLTEQNMQQLIDLGLKNVQSQQEQHLKLQLQNKQCQLEIDEQQTAKIQIERLNKQKNKKILELKQKNEAIRSLLNNIFQQDSLIVRIIADKKVYPEISHPQELNPLQVESQLKHQEQTSDNFFPKTTLQK